ncbi:MAG TPA: class I SAM-dependent methyltransferase [Phycisphaerae bacterium]|nr:class I SAM-dependent methyltransferase [Phycisphaerae bacterium]
MTRSAMAICTPIPFRAGTRVLERITVEFHRAKLSLARPTCFNFCEIVADGMEVGVARCFAVEKALEQESPPEFIFWLDYDVLPSFDAMTKLFYRARCYPEYDVFAGVYCSKGSPPEPLIYMEQGAGPFWDWAVGDLLFDVHGVHSGLTLVRTSLYRKMLDEEPGKPLYLTTDERKFENGRLHTRTGTEDLWFCRRACDDFGARIMVDTSVLAGHINNATGKIFGLLDDSPPIQRSHFMRKRTVREQFDFQVKVEDGPNNVCIVADDKAGNYRYLHADGKVRWWIGGGRGAGWFQNVDEASAVLAEWKSRQPLSDEKLALDIGAGATRREWPGYRTYTTDIRPETAPDYVMDSRLLNLPDEEFDLVSSCHHLEHLGRWDQERVWGEMARVLKPGGRMEHIVPSLEWAAAHIMDGHADESVFNVLYGAQEAQGYRREMNTHFMGFTRPVARAMAEEVAGLVDVQVRDWRDDEALGLNLVISGNKPGPKKPGPKKPRPKKPRPKKRKR